MKQSDLIFKLDPIDQTQYGYFHLNLTVWVPRFGPAKYDEAEDIYASPRDTNAVTFRWQWGNSEEHQRWYGFGIRPLYGGDFNNLDDMKFCMQVARKAIPVVNEEGWNKSDDTTPVGILTHLLRVGTYVVLDRRDGNFYQPGRVKPEGMYYYCARSGTVPGEQYAIGHVWAYPEDATDMVDARIEESKGAEVLRKWRDAGSPVNTMSNDHNAPDLRNPLDRLDPYAS